MSKQKVLSKQLIDGLAQLAEYQNKNYTEKIVLGVDEKGEPVEAYKWLYIGDDEMGKNRYVLGEVGTNPLICFGVNPSTAVPEKLDSTLKVVKKTAEAEGYDGWIVLNIWPTRKTKLTSEDLKGNNFFGSSSDVYRENSKFIEFVLWAYPDAPCWAAWGELAKNAVENSVLENVKVWGRDWLCRGLLSKDGHPHHPLYVASDEKLREFNMYEYLRANSHFFRGETHLGPDGKWYTERTFVTKFCPEPILREWLKEDAAWSAFSGWRFDQDPDWVYYDWSYVYDKFNLEKPDEKAVAGLVKWQEENHLY